MNLIRLPEALKKTGLSRTRAYVLIAKRQFPQPVKISPDPNARAIAFSSDEIDAWIAQRMAEREEVE